MELRVGWTLIIQTFSCYLPVGAAPWAHGSIAVVFIQLGLGSQAAARFTCSQSFGRLRPQLDQLQGWPLGLSSGEGHPT